MSKTQKKEAQTKFLDIKRTPTRAQIRRVEWDVLVPADVTVDDLLVPSYWANVVESTFKHYPFNKVAVHWEDGTKYAELYVRQATNTFAIVEVLGSWDFEDKSDLVSNPDDYDIKWAGPTAKYRIIRKKDNQIIKDGFATALAADDYVGALGK